LGQAAIAFLKNGTDAPKELLSNLLVTTISWPKVKLASAKSGSNAKHSLKKAILSGFLYFFLSSAFFHSFKAFLSSISTQNFGLDSSSCAKMNFEKIRKKIKKIDFIL